MTALTLSRGDIVLTRFPFTDLTGASLRPALVVSPGQIGEDVVLVAISSVVRGSHVPTDYLEALRKLILETSVIEGRHKANTT